MNETPNPVNLTDEEKADERIAYMIDNPVAALVNTLEAVTCAPENRPAIKAAGVTAAEYNSIDAAQAAFRRAFARLGRHDLIDALISRYGGGAGAGAQ